MILTVSLTCAHILFWLGLYGMIARRHNLIITLVCLEMSLLGVALLFASSGASFDDIFGQITFFLLLTLAGVESALGLALVILYYRIRTQVRWSSLVAVKG